jgi:hypothetical protein
LYRRLYSIFKKCAGIGKAQTSHTGGLTFYWVPLAEFEFFTSDTSYFERCEQTLLVTGPWISKHSKLFQMHKHWANPEEDAHSSQRKKWHCQWIKSSSKQFEIFTLSNFAYNSIAGFFKETSSLKLSKYRTTFCSTKMQRRSSFVHEALCCICFSDLGGSLSENHFHTLSSY